MGSMRWSYFVPYQEDINKALQELKQEVFEKGQYQQPYSFDPKEVESQVDYLAALYQSLPSEIKEHTDQFLEMARSSAKQQLPGEVPQSIQQLLDRCGSEGTHSILDMEKVSSRPGFGAITPIPHEKLLEIFGTEQPGRETVEKWATRIDPPDVKPLFERWQGIYIILYMDKKPVEIYFEGCSGD